MNRKILFWPLAAVLLTACEKGLDVGVDGISTDGGQVKNSVLQVRTRAGGSAYDEATVSYPVTVYVFRGGSSDGSFCLTAVPDWDSVTATRSDSLKEWRRGSLRSAFIFSTPQNILFCTFSEEYTNYSYPPNNLNKA